MKIERQINEHPCLVKLTEAGEPGLILADNHPFTDKQSDVLRMIINGYSNKETAQLLGMGRQTVKNHVYDMFSQIEGGDPKSRPRCINELIFRLCCEGVITLDSRR